MIGTSDLSNGTVFEYDNNIWQVVWFQHHKPGKGGAMIRLKLRNVRTGAIIERTFKSGEKFRQVSLNKRRAQFLYKEGNKVHFMDSGNFEQMEISTETLDGQEGFLMENMEVDALYLDEEFLSIELPASVKLTVVSTVPGVKGDSATNVTKPATLETGIEVSVPLFVKEGDLIKVDTRTKEYIERA